MLEAHIVAGRKLLDGASVAFAGSEIRVELDMAYLGQTHTIAVPIDGAEKPGGLRRAAIAEAFDAAYLRAYGRLLQGGIVRLLNLKTAVIGKRPKFDLATLAPGPEASLERATRTGRHVYIHGRWHDTRVFDRLLLPVGAVIEGPAILEQPDTTILIEPGTAGTVDRFGNLLLERQE